ncbi:MAG: class I tRNA ligase family protein, partial [Myxococcota bacterium]
YAPHLAEELWSKLGHAQSLASSPWPAHDEALLRDADIELPVQINGKVKGKITVPAASEGDETRVKQIVLADEKIKAQLEGKTVRKFILVPGKIVNIVAN